MASTITMSTALHQLSQLQELLERLDGAEVDSPGGEVNNRAKRQQFAITSRQLLLAQHLAEKVKVAIADQFFVFRGMD